MEKSLTTWLNGRMLCPADRLAIKGYTKWKANMSRRKTHTATSAFDGWQRSKGGTLTKEVFGQDVSITPIIGGVRLDADGLSWITDNLDDMAPMVQFYEAFMSRKEARYEREYQEFEEDLGDGFTLVAKGGITNFDVSVWYGSEQVGYYQGFTNSAIATFVLGRDTVQGAEVLEQVARRRGFGDRMRDAAEKLTGLPAVPHGRNFTTGSLSEAAVKSWDRRAKVKGVPGYGTDLGVGIRKKLAEAGTKRLRDMDGYALSLVYALSLAEISGKPLMVGCIEDRPVCGWVVGPDDAPYDPSRLLDVDQLKRFAADYRYSASDVVEFREMSFTDVVAAVGRWDWRSFVDEDVRAFTGDMAKLLGDHRTAFEQTIIEPGAIAQTIPSAR